MSTQSNRAVYVDATSALVLAPAAEPTPYAHEALIQVAATSLNRGETRRSLTSAAPGWRPGWDVSGTILRQAADGSGPVEGTRVVGILPTSGGWAERVAIPTSALAELPDEVTFAQAACLPVAGLTALYALSKRGDLIGRRVLVTGATGGVGHFACQLARAAGARTVAAVRTSGQIVTAQTYGADEVVVTADDPDAIRTAGPFDLIVESVGGAVLEASLGALAPGGVCVCVGVSSGAAVNFDAEAFFYSTASLTGIVLFKDLQTGEGAAAGLSRLLRLMVDGKLAPHIGQERSWTEVDKAGRDLLERAIPGKIVLHIDDRP